MSRSGVRVPFPARRASEQVLHLTLVIGYRRTVSAQSITGPHMVTRNERARPRNRASSAVAAGELAELVPSWERSLRAARRSAKTRKNYPEAAGQLLAYF